LKFEFGRWAMAVREALVSIAAVGVDGDGLGVGRDGQVLEGMAGGRGGGG
jgi:hypothetical protein